MAFGSYLLFVDTSAKRAISGITSASVAPPLQLLYGAANWIFDVHYLTVQSGRVRYTREDDFSTLMPGELTQLLAKVWIRNPENGDNLLLATGVAVPSDPATFFPEPAIEIEEFQEGDSTHNSIHKVKIEYNPISGTFAFREDETSGPRTDSFDVTNYEVADVQSQLEVLYGAGNVKVDEWDPGKSFLIEYIGDLKNSVVPLPVLTYLLDKPKGQTIKLTLDSDYDSIVRDSPGGTIDATITLDATFSSYATRFLTLASSVISDYGTLPG